MSIRARSRGLQNVFRNGNAIKLGGAVVAGLVATTGWRPTLHMLHSLNPSTAIQGKVTLTGPRIWRSLATAVDHRLSPLSILTTSTMTLTPPQPAPEWNHTPEDVIKLTKELIEKDRAIQDKVGALTPEECTFSSVCRVFLYATPMLK
jgi:hypothetical protein